LIVNKAQHTTPARKNKDSDAELQGQNKKLTTPKLRFDVKSFYIVKQNFGLELNCEERIFKHPYSS